MRGRPFLPGGGQPRATEAAASDLPHPKVTTGSGRASGGTIINSIMDTQNLDCVWSSAGVDGLGRSWASARRIATLLPPSYGRR
eukprot:SAG31_NODE_1752_length_7351_cov_29.035852_7_plen_84_part_00